MELKPPLKIFLDSSVIISGLFSHLGASYKILELCCQQKLQPQICGQVLVETERNIAAKIPAALPNYLAIINGLNTLEVSAPTLREVKAAQEIINPKDAPILAAAIKAQSDYFITLDVKHFDLLEVKEKSGLNIMTPGKFVKLGCWR